MIELIGILFLSIECLILKNISFNTSERYYNKEYIKYNLRVWHLFILVPLNLYWVVSIISFAIFAIIFFIMLTVEDIKINYNKDSTIFKFLNKEL